MLAVGHVPAVGGQEIEAVRQSRADRSWRQHAHPGRRKLDGQRQTVEGDADVRDRASFDLVECERCLDLPRTLEEQFDRRRGAQLDQRRAVDQFGQGQRAQRIHDFVLQAQCFAAGGQDPHVRTTQQPLDCFCSRGEDVLAVVQHDQHLAVLEMRCEALAKSASARVLDVEGVTHRVEHELGFQHGSQFDYSDLAVQARFTAGRDRERQGSLTGATRTDQGDQARRRVEQQVAYVGGLSVATNQTSQHLSRTKRTPKGYSHMA